MRSRGGGVFFIYHFMKTVFSARVLNVFRSHTPKGWYSRLKGHTGVDLDFNFEAIPSPITGEVIGITHQVEMGNCLYIRDVNGTVHVFAHLSQFKVKIHGHVKRGDVIAISGDSGSRSTAPHLHYEIICMKWQAPLEFVMTRSLMGFKGYNADPLIYDRKLYASFGIAIS